MTISFRAADIPSSDLAEKPLGQPSAEPLTGDETLRKVFVVYRPTVS